MKYDSIYDNVSSYEVEALILFVDNTQALASKRDKIYEDCKGDRNKMGSCFGDVEFLLAIKSAYNQSIEKLSLDNQQKAEFINYYVDQYSNWLIDHPEYADKKPLNGDTDEAIISALNKCVIEDNVIKLPKEKLPDGVFKEVKKRLENIGGCWKGGKIGGFVFQHDPTHLLADISAGSKRNIQKETQLYQTSKKLADIIKDMIIWKRGRMKVLEPSAGRGALLSIFDDYQDTTDVDIIEKNEQYREYLSKYFVDLNNHIVLLPYRDFLDVPKKLNNRYDLIVANPPYTGKQDVKHVNKMMDLLKPGGQLITFMAAGHLTNNDQLSVDFRNRIKHEFDGDYMEIPVEDWENNGAKVKTVLYNLIKVEKYNESNT